VPHDRQRPTGPALAGESQAPRNLAIAYNNIATDRQRQVGSINDKRPLVAMTCKVEGDAIVGIQVVRRLRHTPAGEIRRGGNHNHSALSEPARHQLRGPHRTDANRNVGPLIHEVDDLISKHDV
jgi:hypothetical protein